MIRYTLRCAEAHAFDSWFRDSDACDALASAGQIVCPRCGSTDVRKALMAPSVMTSRRRASAPAPSPAVEETPPARPETTPQPVSLLDEKAQKLRAVVRELRRQIVENADDVGRDFAAEARAIHEKSAPPRSIYGEATREEVSALVEDGIPLMPMPMLPDDHH